MTTLNLSGLKGHHPLGFLAACGLLRIASTEIDMKLGWAAGDRNDTGLTACAHSTSIETQIKLRDRLVKIVAASASRYLVCLDEYGLTQAEAIVDDYRQKGREIINNASTGESAARIGAELLPGIGSDLITRQKMSGKYKGTTVIKNSHLIMTSGQQDLLKKKGRQPAFKLAKHSEAGDVPAKIQQKITEALFGPWLYEDDEHSFGWDPQLQRLHALRNKAPTKDNKRRSVFAAVFLASQALPLFPCFAVGGRLRTTGFHRDNREDLFAWPIWRDGISLNALRSLLAHQLNDELRARGVMAVYRCRRVRTGGSSKGNYQVFSQSEQWLR